MTKQKDIADRAGISRAYFSQIKNGARRPSLKTAKALTKAVPGTAPMDWLENPCETALGAIAGVAE